MVASPHQPQKMTVEEYFTWELQQNIRYEYVHGEVFAMTGGTIPHNDIALNLYTALRRCPTLIDRHLLLTIVITEIFSWQNVYRDTSLTNVNSQ